MDVSARITTGFLRRQDWYLKISPLDEIWSENVVFSARFIILPLRGWKRVPRRRPLAPQGEVGRGAPAN